MGRRSDTNVSIVTALNKKLEFTHLCVLKEATALVCTVSRYWVLDSRDCAFYSRFRGTNDALDELLHQQACCESRDPVDLADFFSSAVLHPSLGFKQNLDKKEDDTKSKALAGFRGKSTC